MPSNRFLHDEEGRIRELHSLRLLDSPADPAYDSITQLAADICEAPLAVITLVDSGRTWFKSCVGSNEQQMARDASFCSYTVQGSEPVVVEDARTDVRFHQHPQALMADGLRFYAGIPLVTSAGYAIGTLCLASYKPQSISQQHLRRLQLLASQVQVLIELRRSNLQLQELELRSSASEQRLSFALHAARLGDFSRDLRTGISTRSLQHDLNFGYSQRLPEWSFETFVEHVDPRDRNQVVDAFNTARDQHGDYDIEFRVRWPDGSAHWLWTKGRFTYDAQGQPITVIGIQGDVTQRRQSESALVASNARYQLLFENSMDAIMQTTVDGRVLFANPAACRLFGYSEAEFCHAVRRDLVKLSDPRLAALLVQRSIARFAHGQITMRRRDGSEFEAEISSNVYLDQDGHEMTSMVVVDITQRLEHERNLRLQHEQLVALEAQHRGLLGNLNTGIVVHGPQTDILFCNKRACELLGLSEDQMQGKTAVDSAWHFVDEAENPMLLQDYPVNRVLASGQAIQEMVIGVHRAAGLPMVWLLGTAFPELDAAGALKHVVVNFQDITRRKIAETETWTEANFDHLTSLPNRRLFHDRLGQEIRQSQRDNNRIALLFLDLDRFKDVNDSLGHDVGDLLLVEAARRIKACIRESDTLARLGGDEFTVVLSHFHEASDIAVIATKIIASLSLPFELNYQEALLSASIGIALFPSDAGNAIELIKHADQAMYVAKNDGRGCYRFFTKNMQEAAESKMLMAADLRHALRDQQLELYYQPIVHLRSGAIYKAEGLLRWKHPQWGFVSPATFIPIAEDSGAIHDIGDWVFLQAARQVQRWQAIHPNFQISINKSPVQFAVTDDVHDGWIEQLGSMGLSGHCIAVEITEGLLMNNSKAVTDKLLKFRDAGMQVAIDDFGTGYSSLSYLKKFDIDYLKIDQSFTRNLGLHTPDLALCEAIVVMAHKLGLQVIAEGVETLEQRDLLLQIGCDYAQGYFYAKAMPAVEFERYLSGAQALPVLNPEAHSGRGSV